MLHVGLYRKSLGSQVLLKGPEKIEITGREIGIVGRAVNNHLAVAPQSVASLIATVWIP